MSWKALFAFRRLSWDKEISLCDAISYVVVTEYPEFLPYPASPSTRTSGAWD